MWDSIAIFEYYPYYLGCYYTSNNSTARLGLTSDATNSRLGNNDYRVIYENIPGDNRRIDITYSANNDVFRTASLKETDAVKFLQSDVTVGGVFSNSNKKQAFRGDVDYLYIEQDLDFSEAMQYVEKYGAVLSKSVTELTLEDEELLSDAMADYNTMSEGVRVHLVRNEYEKLKEASDMFSTGECELKGIDGNEETFTVSGGSGSKDDPYIAYTDMAYDKFEIPEREFVTKDIWAQVSVEGSVDKLVNELDVSVSSLGKTAYYKLIAYALDVSNVSDIAVKEFLQMHSETFRKTVALDEDRIAFTSAMSDYKALSSSAKNALIRGEYETLSTLGSVFATGDCGIKYICKNTVTANGGMGTEENPYKLTVDLPYNVSEITENDFLTDDVWAMVSAHGKTDKFINEIKASVSSAQNTAYYVITAYSVDENSIENINAKQFIGTYKELFRKTEAIPADNALLTQAVEAYKALPDEAKNELVRNEYEVLIALGKKLADGRCGIEKIAGKPVTVSEGNGTQQSPYVIITDCDYTKTAVTAEDVVTTDPWATVKISGDISSMINELDVTVTSDENTAAYKVIMLASDEGMISNADAKEFIAQNKSILTKLEVSANDKSAAAEAIAEYDALSKVAKSNLSRNERETLVNVHTKAIISGINQANDAASVISAAENTIGAYPMDEDAAKYLLHIRPNGGFKSIDEFENAYRCAVLVSDIPDAVYFDILIKENSDILKDTDADISKMYEELSDNAKAKFEEYAKATDFCNEYSIITNLRRAVILAKVKTAKTAGAIQNTVLGTNEIGEQVNNNPELIGASLAEYNSLKNPSEVFSYMYQNLVLIADFDDILTYFNAGVAEQKRIENTTVIRPAPGGGGGGGGGSSSSGKGGVTANVSMPVSSNDEFKNPFADIEEHWGKAAILSLAEKGIASGYEDNTFRPDNTVTRAEFVKLATDAFDIKATDTEITFNDLVGNEWYAPYIKSAVSAGLITGSDDGNVYPDNSITREDATVILYRYLKNKIAFENKTFSFKDNDEIAAYCIEAVNDMAYAGIINGVGSNRFMPKGIMTRAQAVTIISNALDYMQGGM